MTTINGNTHVEAREKEAFEPQMGLPTDQHDTLMSGLAIECRTASGRNGYGVISAIATRTRDKAKVLVTASHVIANLDPVKLNPGDVERYVYHPYTDGEYRWVGTFPVGTSGDTDQAGWIVKKKAPFKNPADAAYCVIRSLGDGNFNLHDATHSNKIIVPGTRDPQKGDTLTLLSASQGEGTVTVTRVGFPENVGPIEYKNLFEVDITGHPTASGDSGAPYLYHLEGNKYQMAGIHMAGSAGARRALACLASVVETELGITFGNDRPTANAGVNQIVLTRERVLLNGKGSTDPNSDRLTYRWAQIIDPVHPVAVTISSPTQATTVFRAPDKSASLVFQLTVTDPSGESDTDTVTVTVKNRPPIAHAGADQVVNSGATATLDGSKSKDPDSDKLTFKWEQLGEPGTPESPGTPGVTLSSTTAVKPTFTAPTSAGALSFKLTVTDSQKASHSDTVNVTVLERVVEALGTLDYGQYITRRGDWSAAIPSVNRPGRYAKFYCFNLAQRSKVQIDLASSVDTFLCLLLGTKTNGDVLQMGVIEEGGEIGYKGYSVAGLTQPISTWSARA